MGKFGLAFVRQLDFSAATQLCLYMNVDNLLTAVQQAFRERIDLDLNFLGQQKKPCINQGANVGLLGGRGIPTIKTP